MRRFRKSSNVRQLYLFVEAELEGAVSKAFDVRTVRPPSSVRCAAGLVDSCTPPLCLSPLRVEYMEEVVGYV